MLHTIKSSLNANMRGISVIANNIANSNTTAFKRSNSNFSDVYSTTVSSSPKSYSGMGVINNDPRKQMFQGPLKQTGGALDLAISGLGFFTLQNVKNVEKSYFTRDGSFSLLKDGNVVNSEGLSLMGHSVDDSGTFNPGLIEKVEIPLTKNLAGRGELILTNVNVSPSGVLKAVYGLDTEVVISKLPLASFNDMTQLKSEGNNLYRSSPKSGLPQYGLAIDGTYGEIIPGFLEASNVEITDELAKMIKYQQAFTGNSRLLQTEVEIAEKLINR